MIIGLLFIGGVRTAASSALFGGVILAFIEGIGIAMTKLTSAQYKPVKPMEPPMPVAPVQVAPQTLTNLSSSEPEEGTWGEPETSEGHSL
jgi:hypothetical protein